MTNKLLILVIVAIAISCSSNNTSSESSSSEAKANNEEVKEQVLPEILQNVSSDLESIALPFTAKSEIFEAFNADIELDENQFNFLRTNYRSIYKYDDWYLKECGELYKMKTEGSYEDYVNSLDIGMLSDCIAYPYAITKTPEAILYYWFIDYSSYEACPYFSGRELLVSKIVDGKVESCLQIGIDSSGGDPPVSGSSITEFTLDNGFKLSKIETDEAFEDDVLISKEQRDTTVTF